MPLPSVLHVKYSLISNSSENIFLHKMYAWVISYIKHKIKNGNEHISTKYLKNDKWYIYMTQQKNKSNIDTRYSKMDHETIIVSEKHHHIWFYLYGMPRSYRVRNLISGSHSLGVEKDGGDCSWEQVFARWWWRDSGIWYPWWLHSSGNQHWPSYLNVYENFTKTS